MWSSNDSETVREWGGENQLEAGWTVGGQTGGGVDGVWDGGSGRFRGVWGRVLHLVQDLYGERSGIRMAGCAGSRANS